MLPQLVMPSGSMERVLGLVYGIMAKLQVSVLRLSRSSS